MFVPLDLNMPAMLVDTETGTAIFAEGVRAIPMDVWDENMMDDKSDSEISSFGERYGVPLFVRVS
jgi:hypothetical protein